MNFTSLLEKLLDFSITSLQKLKSNGNSDHKLMDNSEMVLTANTTLGDYFRQIMVKWPARSDLINLKLFSDGNFQNNDEEISAVINRNLKLPQKPDNYLDNYSRSLSKLIRPDKFTFIKVFCLSFISILLISFVILLYLIRKKNAKKLNKNKIYQTDKKPKDQKF